MAAVVVLVPAALWLVAVDLETRFGSPAAALKSLANLSALTGTAAFAATLVLAARLGGVERLMGGFDRMYRIHRVLGYTVPMILVAHAVFAASSEATSSVRSGFTLFLPTAGWGVFVGVIALVGVVAILLAPLLRSLRHETFVRIHRLIGVTFLLGIAHVLLVPSTWDLPSLLVSYLLGLLVAGVAAFAYRSAFGRYAVRRRRYRIEQVNALGTSAVELVLSTLDGAMSWQAGQFAFVTILDDQMPREAHPFSITSAPSDPRLRFVVKSLGDYTSRLLDLRAGGVALIEGPYGGFRFDDAASLRQIWIAGGVGVTPFLGMARTLDDPRYEIDLYYCTERADDAFVQDELLELSDANPRLRVIPIRRASLGHITVEDIGAASGDLVMQDVFICGPPVMVHNLRHQLLQRGVRSAQIHFEDFAVLSP